MVVNIQKFNKRSAVEILFFGYVNALRLNFPAVTLESAIGSFIKHHNIDPEEISPDTMRTIYYRMEKEYMEAAKDEV